MSTVDIDRIILMAEAAALTDKSEFADMDNNPMNRQILTREILKEVATHTQTLKAELLAKMPKGCTHGVRINFVCQSCGHITGTPEPLTEITKIVNEL